MKGYLRMLMVAVAPLWAAAAHAQTDADLTEVYGPILRQCYDAAGDGDARQACIWKMSETCMAQEQGGQSTLGMTDCQFAESRVWDSILNREYKALMAGARDEDADDSFNFPEFAHRVEKLRLAERAWIAFRDAECDFSYSLWGPGSARNPAAAGCLVQLTAERAITLRDYLGRYQ